MSASLGQDDCYALPLADIANFTMAGVTGWTFVDSPEVRTDLVLDELHRPFETGKEYHIPLSVTGYSLRFDKDHIAIILKTPADEAWFYVKHLLERWKAGEPITVSAYFCDHRPVWLMLNGLKIEPGELP